MLRTAQSETDFGNVKFSVAKWLHHYCAAVNPHESLLDTVPGRLFIEHLRFIRYPADASPLAVVASMKVDDLMRAAIRAVGRYLYSPDCYEVARIDNDDQEDLREFDAAALDALAAVPTFGSPQIHQGVLHEIHPPIIGNRTPLCALPDGAFWTSTPITKKEDSWTLTGENLHRDHPRWLMYFDETDISVARIDSAHDWVNLVESNAIISDGCKYPNWPAIAESWEAVHLSLTGLLLAHPKLSEIPLISRDGTGHAHSKAGHYASVAAWSTVSTAWLQEPPSALIRPLAETSVPPNAQDKA